MCPADPAERLGVRLILKWEDRKDATSTGPVEGLSAHLILKWEGRIGRRRGDGGIRVSANASREGKRGPGRDDGVCLSAS